MNEHPPTDDRPATHRPTTDPLSTADHRPPIAARLVAFFEVVLCSDYPSQLAIGTTLRALRISPIDSSGALSLRYVVILSLADTLMLVGLIVFFLRSHGERLRDVMLGERAVTRELRLGLPMAVVAFAVAVVVMGAVHLLAPALHTVSHNPLQDLMRRPRDVGFFALVVVVAGGIREEMQRAFVLHRFRVWLGGTTVGIVVSSVAFGAGHLLQGDDAAIATGLLGVFWGVLYARRRSVVAPVVSHAGFNLLELVQYVLGRP